MRVLKLMPTERFGSNTFILISEREAAVVDPSVDYSKVKNLAAAENLQFKYIILTHAHFDHILEIDSWVKNTSAEVIVGENDAPMLADSYLNCYRIFSNKDAGYYGSYKTVRDAELLQIGKETLKVMHTPGHTPGSITLSSKDALFVGDTLFFGGSYGRCDLPGGDEGKIFSSIRYILSEEKDKTVYSGHGPDTTLNELKSNFI